ncbi:Hypothetical protein SMAX5B_016994 [Scophthalmus maximus]|uniref:Uncharacterized protein n=1 Tax=Scophthalmus maximus TaxID=52904 RepID=A0A2U9BA04_SCOMX|nr:Hypothetical protein SMAX5B_016994 [Scophthalmus maximus]
MSTSSCAVSCSTATEESTASTCDGPLYGAELQAFLCEPVSELKSLRDPELHLSLWAGNALILYTGSRKLMVYCESL